MTEQATLSGLAFAGQSKVNVKIEVSAQINVSAYVARQKANRFLIMQVGDQLCAGEPELVVGAALNWRVPIQYAPSRRGVLGNVGHLMIDADTGEVTIADDRKVEDLLKGAEAIDERASLSTGA
jgi:hypothetical protein